MLKHQPRLVLYALQQESPNVIVLSTIDGYRTLFDWVMELSVASLLSDDDPSVFLQIP